jgi:hypothetical protein
MLHEHQNNLNSSNTIKLITDNVYSYYTNCLGSDRTTADVNTIQFYNDDPTKYSGSSFDPDSIMLYYLPDCWVNGTNPTKPNFKLSKTDIQFLQENYPLDSHNMPKLKVQFLDGPEWKKAWVQYMVSTTLAPIVGVNFYFYDTDNTPLSNTENIGKSPSGPSVIFGTSVPSISSVIGTVLGITQTPSNTPGPMINTNTQGPTTTPNSTTKPFRVNIPGIVCKDCVITNCDSGNCKASCQACPNGFYNNRTTNQIEKFSNNVSFEINSIVIIILFILFIYLFLFKL